MKHFITCLLAVCCSPFPVVCPAQPKETPRGEDSNPGANQDQRFVNGYERALEFLAEKLSQQAQTDDLLVVWLFDESASMRDDQHEVASSVAKMHAEIQNKLRSLAPARNRDDAVKYCVYSFGSTTHATLETPSSELGAVRTAIKRVPSEESGEENTIHAVGAVIGQTSKLAAKSGRRLMLILVTDEAGDDADNDKLLEAAVSRVQQARSPIYVLGREATFGQRYGRMPWIDPKFRMRHWLRVRRGPESAMIESLQWNGFNARLDIQSAACGPYALLRLAKASGGACLMLPASVGGGFRPSIGPENGAVLLPLKYQPSYEPRLAYLQNVIQSPFRSTLQEIIGQLDPSTDSQLSIREHGYPFDEAEFEKEAAKQLSKIQHAYRLLDQFIAKLEKIRSLRDKDTSPRWQAHYDLISAQLAAYRLRLEQAALALVQHIATNPSVDNKKFPNWRLSRAKEPIRPDESQYARFKELLNLNMTREEYLEQFEADVETMRQLLQDVIDRHPKTPWAYRAKYELQNEIGMMVRPVLRSSLGNVKFSLPRF